MNPLVELEAKFDASALTFAQFENWAYKRYGHNAPPSEDGCDPIANSAIKQVVGLDTFYGHPGQRKTLRYRRAGSADLPHGPPSLTYKQRQSPGNIRDRFEIDLFLSENRPTDDSVRNLLQTLGFEEHFTILKESHIWHFPDFVQIAVDPDGSSPATRTTAVPVIVALYDVLQGGAIRRFLEVEIDRDAEIDDPTAEMLLSDWILEVQGQLGLREPLTQSLYEMYAPRNHLFFPETF